MPVTASTPGQPAPAAPVKPGLTMSLVDKLKGAPLGGITGALIAGLVIWFRPGSIPEGWTGQSVLALGVGIGIAAQRALSALTAWFLEPVVRHLGARSDAAIALFKLDRYVKRGLIAPEDAGRMATVIARADVNGGRRERKRIVVPKPAPKPPKPAD